MADVDIQKKIDEFLQSAFKKFLGRDYENAIQDLKSAEMLDRGNPEILYNLGINYCRMGLDKTAIGYFKKVLTLNSAFIEAQEIKKLLAYTLIHNGEPAGAEKYVDQVLRLVPTDVVAMNLKGYCLDVRGRRSEALSVYEAIIEVDDKNATAYNAVAYILAQSGGDLQKSLRYANIAYSSNKDNPAYLDTLGYVYLKMGKPDLASQYIGAALQRAPFSDEIKDHARELKAVMNL